MRVLTVARRPVSGRQAPTEPHSNRPIARLPHAAFIAELRALEGTPPAVFEHEDLLELVLPILRADIRAAEDYVLTSGPPLEIPIFAYGGIADTETPPAKIEPWRAQAAGAFATRFFAGGHFFVHGAEPALLAALRTDLALAFMLAA